MREIKNILVCCYFLINTPSLFAQVIDSKYEAIFVYNFTKYIEWSKDDGHGDFIIGILGKGDIVAEMQLMAAQKQVANRKIVIKVFENAEDIEHCHILFITKNQTRNLLYAKQKLAEMSTVYVTESPGMASNGADINFISKANKVLFELNEKSLNSRNILVSSDLKKFAVIVN